jgi:hypothetical protein
MDSTSLTRSLRGFRVAWRNARGFQVEAKRDELAVAAASNDIETVGRLLGPRGVNAICFSEEELPESLVRRPFGCSLLDVAVGSGSVEMTKYLLEFHRARPTRETLKQSISIGSLELIKLMRERMPEGGLRDRVDLREAAAEFHRNEVLVWLLRDTSNFERELLAVFALERKLADSLVVALENGLHPWWSRTREVSLKWRASAMMGFASAPEGFSSEGGWWTDLSGATSTLRGLGSESLHGPGLPDGVVRVGSAVEFKWTAAMSQAQLGDGKLVRLVVFPPGVTAIGVMALSDFGALESVVFPVGCIEIGGEAFAECKALKTVSLPVGCKATGYRAFAGCTSLVNALIPAGCLTISDGCFSQNISMMGVRFPDGLRLIGRCAFWKCALREVMIPDGCDIARSAFQRCTVLVKVSIGRDCTSLGEWAFSECTALTKVTFGEGLKWVGRYAFDNCCAIASVVLPASVHAIDESCFGGCTSLATIAVPKRCRLHKNAFLQCSPRVTRF